MKIGVGINTYNGWSRVANVLESLHQRNPGVPRTDILIALYDDGTPTDKFNATFSTVTQGTLRTLENEGHCAFLNRNHDNRGIAPSWNALADKLFTEGADVALILNDDVLLEDRWAEAIQYFYLNNDTSKIGTVFFAQFFFRAEDVSGILADPRESWRCEPISKEYLTTHWENTNVGAVVAPAGCAFAFTRDAFDAASRFPEHFVSFHEESLFGHRLTEQGRPAFCLPYPVIWHQWSATFRDNPELKASATMRKSRKLFCDEYGVPEEFSKDPFRYTHPLVMSKWPGMRVKFLLEDGPHEGFVAPCMCEWCKTHRSVT